MSKTLSEIVAAAYAGASLTKTATAAVMPLESQVAPRLDEMEKLAAALEYVADNIDSISVSTDQRIDRAIRKVAETTTPSVAGTAASQMDTNSEPVSGTQPMSHPKSPTSPPIKPSGSSEAGQVETNDDQPLGEKKQPADVIKTSSGKVTTAEAAARALMNKLATSDSDVSPVTSGVSGSPAQKAHELGSFSTPEPKINDAPPAFKSEEEPPAASTKITAPEDSAIKSNQAAIDATKKVNETVVDRGVTKILDHAAESRANVHDVPLAKASSVALATIQRINERKIANGEQIPLE